MDNEMQVPKKAVSEKASTMSADNKLSRPAIFTDIDGIFLSRATCVLDLESGMRIKEDLGKVAQNAVHGVSAEVSHPKDTRVSKSELNASGVCEKPGWKKPPRPPRAPGSVSKERSSKGSPDSSSTVRKAKLQRLKKERISRAASSKTNVFALLVTLVFCAIMIFQGINSEHSNNSESWRKLGNASSHELSNK